MFNSIFIIILCLFFFGYFLRFLYLNRRTDFNVYYYKFVNSWQQEVAETVFETVNQEADKVEVKRKAKQKQRFDADEKESDCILHGYIKKLGGAFSSVWQTRYAKLYPNRYVSFFCCNFSVFFFVTLVG